MTQRVPDQFHTQFGEMNLNSGSLPPGVAMQQHVPPGFHGMPMGPVQMPPGLPSTGGVVLDPNYINNGQNMMIPNLGQFIAMQGNMLSKPTSEDMILSPDRYVQNVSTNSGDSPLNMQAIQGTVNPALLNMDIPRSNFMNAMNFGSKGAEGDTQQRAAQDDTGAQADDEDLLEQSLGRC